MDTTYVSPSFATLKQYASYNHSLTSSTSTIAASVWSDTASQSSDDTSVSNSDSDSCESFCSSQQSTHADNALAHRRSMFQNKTEAAVPVELRQNPRRSGPGIRARGACPPALVRQCDRKVNFVDSLVGMFCLLSDPLPL